jgi:hypothetical protein
VLLLDLNALGSRELELLIVSEERAIRRAQPKQHTRYEARREEREAEAERKHPHEEVFPFGFRKEVAPLKAAIGVPLGGSPAADESPKYESLRVFRLNPRAFLGAASQPAPNRRLHADDVREDTGQPPPIGRGFM